MNNYTIIMLGWLFGQIGYAAVSAYLLQRKKANTNYWQACSIYFSTEVGSFVMAFSALLIIMFIAPDFIDVKITKEDLLNKDVVTWKEKIIIYFRTAAVLIGGFSQHLIYLAFKKGKRAIDDYDKKKDI